MKSGPLLSFAAAIPAVVLLSAVTSPADAAPVETTFQYWDVFTTLTGDNAPNDGQAATVDVVNPNGDPAVRYLGNPDDAFITSSGNIYSPTVATFLETEVPVEGLGASFGTNVSLVIRTQGNELDYDGVTLSYLDGGEQSQTLTDDEPEELSRVALGGFGGFRVDTLFEFEVPSNPDAFTLSFNAASSSMSLDQVTVDTETVALPEPAGLALLAFGAIPLLRRPRSR